MPAQIRNGNLEYQKLKKIWQLTQFTPVTLTTKLQAGMPVFLQGI
jgi:hypothetical protein